MDNDPPGLERQTMADLVLASAPTALADTNMEAPPESLPSTVDQTLARCPRFRILVVGNTGVGKSSLIANIFNVSSEVSSLRQSLFYLFEDHIAQDIDIPDDRAGIADINKVYQSHDNPRFALHDSKGFEPGMNENWKIVEKFITERSKKKLAIEERLHALWLCIEAPRSGARLMQTADEELLKLAISLKIPVIVAFTKFDLLFNQSFAEAARADRTRTPDGTEVEKNARSSIERSTEQLRKQGVSDSWHDGIESLKTLEQLTEVTTKCLKTKETFVPWAVAQRIDPVQKVQTSIEFFRSFPGPTDVVNILDYWRDMAKSTVFKKHVLKDCLLRIHLDIIKVWNFRDPDKILTGNNFHAQMLSLIEPFMTPPPAPSASMAQQLAPLGAIGSAFLPLSAPLAIALCAVGVALVVISFLYETYKATPETALCLEAYIANLSLFLHELFVTALQGEWHKPLDRELVLATFNSYKDTKSATICEHIRDRAPSARDAFRSANARGNIGDLIRRELNLNGSG
ncbi:hypothetical protein H0H92_004020 [Tricholoma furcatifolium]|nr:hypothetical protein H0H92_004020 [Tricholoma furcatifolium]